MVDPQAAAGDVRDQLALTRTQLANERTMLAYVRTAIMLAVTGATLLKLYGDTMQNQVGGWSLLVASVCVVALGARRFQRLARQLT